MPLTHPACRLGTWSGAAAALGRRPLLRDLPLADADHRPHHARGRRTATSLVRSLLQVAAIFAVAALSWRFVEEPIRHGAIGRFFARRRAVGWKWETFAPPMRVAIVSRGLVLAVAAAGMAGVNSTLGRRRRRPRRAKRGRRGRRSRRR